MIIQFLRDISQALTSAFEFLVGFFEDTVYIIKLTGSFLLKIPQLFSWLPAPAIALIVSIFTVVVIYKVMGREG